MHVRKIRKVCCNRLRNSHTSSTYSSLHQASKEATVLHKPIASEQAGQEFYSVTLLNTGSEPSTSHKRAVRDAVEPQATVTDYTTTKVKLMLGAPKPKTPGSRTDYSTQPLPLLERKLGADDQLPTKKKA